MVFDEQVFPFSSMHPNAGARLHTVISLLPGSLLNSNTTIGDALIPEPHACIPPPANANASSGESLFGAGSNSGENNEEHGAQM